MRSSSGAHFIALDHVRALAAFLVFAWHFTHATTGYPVPFDYVPAIFPFALLDEGHTGVALFMTLSGYLFAKLLDGRTINYGAFIWNRVLRLLPLLTVVLLLGIPSTLFRGGSLSAYALSIVKGVAYPTLPNGGWSITVEFHFYVLLPVLLWMLARSWRWPLALLAGAAALRALIHHYEGEVQSWAYWTLVGRLDQFVLGMLGYHLRSHLVRRHAFALGALSALALVYWLYDLGGGFYLSPSYPSPSALWIVFPTLEGLAYAVGISWYDNSFTHSTSGWSRFIGRLGEYSYSIYLLHFFVVFRAARLVHEHIMDLSNFYVAVLWAILFFVLMVIPGHITFRYVEAPFLKLRRRYIKAPPEKAPGA
jgi:peptidoglycan/LPS O-acetylase OafA/YrhL